MPLTPEQQKTINDVLIRGVGAKDQDMIRLALEKGADSALFFKEATSKSFLSGMDEDLLLFALQKGADPQYLLACGIHEKSLPVVRLAVERGGADVSTACNGYPVTQWIHECFDKPVSGYLFSRGAKIDTQESNGDTCLMRAVRDGNADKIWHYLSHGANPLIANAKGQFPLDAVEKSNWDEGIKKGILKEMLKNILSDAPVPSVSADDFNNVATSQDIALEQPIELTKKKTPVPKEKPPSPPGRLNL